MDPSSIITTLGGYFVEPIKKHCGYLFHYDANIENLRDQIEKLRAKRNTLLTQIEQDTRDNRAPASDLLKWVDDAEKILVKEVEAQKKCLEIEGWGPDYYLSRKAKKKSLQIDKLLSEAAPYVTQMSYSRSLTGIGSSSSEGIKHFESRTTMEDKVLEALADDKVNMVVICGMGGIGKTTMAEEVAKRAKDGKLFDEFVMAVVSRTPNWTKIQDQIAVMLGLNFDNEVGRAKKLSSRLRNSNSVLVILDDVWQALNLGDIGIPHGGEANCCKILLTSRSEEVLINKKKVLNFFKIDDLSEEEAWSLFREAAGNCVDDTDIHSIAKEVANECGRLPQAIVTVGGVLQNESLVEWRAALEQLQNSTPENIPGLDPTVYSSIEFSYSYLKDDAVKSCFLLCCLFPEDSDIPIEYLVRYGVGRGLFEMIDNVAVARDRVHAIIKNLKRSSLLSDSKKEECVKMHDVIRDVAISIAKKEKDFLVRCNDKIEEWPKQDTYEHSAISLVSQELKKHPECSKCPKLELLQLACGKNRTKTQTFPSNMFEEMKKLKVLSMEGMSFPSLPQSILVLQNLRTLLLEYCKIEDVSKLGALGKLEILSFLGSNIKELPREIGNLSHLKLLDLSNCSALQKIPPGLLSRLNYLEELYMFGVNVKWEPMEGNKEGAIASLAELMSMSNRFSALKIHIPNIRVLPKDLPFKNPKLKFQIFAGEKGIYQELSGTGSYLFENSLALESSDASDIAESPVLLQLLEKSEILYLKQIKDLKNILYKLDQEGFQYLKILRVFASKDVEYVIDATSHQTPHSDFPLLHSLELSDLCNLKEIYHGQFPERSFGDGQHQLTCFGNLRSLKLSRCMHLKNVFSFSIARGLVQLQQLVIDSCVIMEAIFLKGEDENAIDEIMFLQLASIELSILPKLIGFCTTVYPVKHVQPYSNQEVRRIGTDEVTSFEKHKMTDIQQHSSSTSISHKFFSSKTILWAPNLERLEFQEDSSLEEIFNLEGLKVDHAILAQLKTLKAQELPNLVYMWKNVPRGIQGFLSLSSIEVDKCDSLKYLLPPSVAKLLVELQSIKIKACGKIQNIVHRDGEEEPVDIKMFPKVTSFMFEDLPNLVSFCIDAYSFRWPSMKEISLGKCPKLKTFGSEMQRPNNLKEISRALDSRPQQPGLGSSSIRDSHGFLRQCLECVGRNYDPIVVSDRGTSENSKGSSSVNKEGTLIKLKNPRAGGIDNPIEIWSLFPSHMIESLMNLKSIKLWRCDSLEVIFQLEECHVASVLDQLMVLDLSSLPKLKHIWKKGPKMITGFGNLRFLALWACHRLTYLLSPSIAKVLVMLEDISIANCEKIEEVLERAREEEEKKVSFDKVRSILLKDLPNLKCFCNEANAFVWPLLKEITVIGCPNLSTFVPSDLETPKLNRVYDKSQGEKDRTSKWMGDLNATIQYMFKGKEKQVYLGTQDLDENMSSSVEGFESFESRIPMMVEVLKALRDNNLNMIAICGLGGIGKTTMVKEVAKKAKDFKLFDEVVMVVVSQNQDLRKIQGQIADMLDLKLGEIHSLIERTERLYKRLMDSKSVLVILDDVWDALDLKYVGIPYGGEHNRCKILLTSRSEEACMQMTTQKIFRIELLSEEEAWNLFRGMAGNCIDTPELHPIAKEVAKECGGLPVAIVTVVKALANKSKVEWIAALQWLKKASPKNMYSLDSKVYSSIELSYNYLGSDEAKSCLLLCCLFPEDHDIPIEYLVRYGVGRSLFAKIDNVVEARIRVHAIVKDLKRSFLLLDSEKKESVKMHDVVRDVTISKAHEHGFLVRCDDQMEEWPKKDTYEHFAAISLEFQEMIKHHDGLDCPKLELLRLSCGENTLQTLPANLFKGMNGLKVLSLRGMSFPSLPQSIQVLQSLRTLLLEFCILEDVSAIGALGKLEILSFLGSIIKELPREIGSLSELKLLDLSDCYTLQRIPPGLLWSLSRLEELYMRNVHLFWEPTEGSREGANASLAELMSFSHSLIALEIHVQNIKLLPKDLHFKNQIAFRIYACEKQLHTEATQYIFKNSLNLERFVASDIAESQTLRQLLAKSEILYLEEIKDIKNIAYELDKEGFQCLKVLDVQNSEDVEYVINVTSDQTPRVAFPILESLDLAYLGNLKEIYHGQFLGRSFSNLKSLWLWTCMHLKNVFSLSIARGLVQLQELQIGDCDDMEEIFPKEEEDEEALDKILFPHLTSISLSSLKRLVGFCVGAGLIELVQSSLNREVGRIVTDEPTTSEEGEMTESQQHATGSNFPESTPIISRKLFSSNTILWPPDLERLKLDGANSLEVVFDLEGQKVDEDHQRITVLAQLKTLEVQDLPKLTYVWKNVPLGIQGFQKLTSIEVSKCHRLRYLFPTSIAKLLVELQSIEIKECDAIENIFQRDGEEEARNIILFPKVSSLKLQKLPNIMSFCIKAYSFEWSSIKEIYLYRCPKLKTIGSEIQSPRKLKQISRELDSRPNEQELGSLGFLRRCLECVPRRKNYGLMAVSDQGTTNKSQRSYSVKEEDTLSKPTDPKVSDIDDPSEIWSFFPSHIIERLKNLESIELINVPSPEVLFQLEELNVEESHMAPVLDQLRKLDLYGLPKLMHIWKKGPERIPGFGNLRLLDVRRCNSLTYLFSPSIAKLLVMLEEIRVYECAKVEEILARETEEEEENEVLFFNVNSIVLCKLPNLKCFCSETNALEWPSLKEIRVIGCPSLSTFIPSHLKTPKLEVVGDNRTNHWKGELNATIEHIFKGKEEQVNHKTQQEEQIETIEEGM